ncbi:MAG TPA: phospholipase D family protein [Micavibrio sp.]|nr:phospholipase D family protein [Micavibrio sp.]
MKQSIKTPSYAIPQDTGCGLADMIREPAARHAGLSGFYIFRTGGESLEGRLFLIRSAEKTLDLQYYAISEGISSNVLIEALIRAAERGVRVRLMIDDVTTGQMRHDLITLDEIPNIEIRIFNPVNKHDQSTPARILAALLHRERATRRMHNKALIADNQMAIVGGRNLGDEYFETHKEMSFKDIDVLSAGPIAADISRSFDEFWNDDHAYPVLQLYKERRGHKALQDIRTRLRSNWQKFSKRFRDGKSHGTVTRIEGKEIVENFVWADADLVTDASAKVQGAQNFSPPLLRLKEIVDRAKEKFIIVSAYFVPRERGVAWLSSLSARGVRVKILTNSLASTDVVAVHTGYGKHRIPLLDQGVSIYELKPHGDKRTRQRLLARKAPSYASLHAKAYIVDREYAVIGSFNFDPRSAYLNTELGLFIKSPELARQLYGMFEEAATPEVSYKLGLSPGNRLIWTTRDDGPEIRYVTEPQASPWRVLQAFLISLLPVEGQL